MIVQRFNLNLIPNQSPVVVHVNQYDTGTGRLIATLYEGNEPYSPNGTAVIQGTKPDGHGFQYTATLDGNVVTADLTEQMAPVAGDVRAQIVVTESSGVTGTFVFIMRVQPSALPSDTDMSESDYPLIEEAIREAQEAVIDSRDNAENSEAWAQGTRGGIPVGPTDPTYEHNAEYWAHQAEGAASGVSSFNGRSGSVLPMAGDYDSEKILLASALHIGGETQDNVQEALEALVNDGGAGHTILNGLGQEMPQRKNLRFAGANLSDDAENDTTNVIITGGSGGSTITVTTIETTLYGETVTITDGTSTFTGVFDNSGVCVIDGVTVTGTLTVSSGAASRTLNVPYFGNYTVALSFWAATINVSTDPDVVNAIVKKDGVQIDTISFSAGSGVYIADSTGAYTFTATVGGVEFTSPTVNVTEQTTYSTIIDIFNATLSISTSSSELYGKTITIKKGSTTVGTTAFSAQGSASYTVHETGTYTCECEGYSGSATVSAETTYPVTINAGLDLHEWISAGSTTDYPLNPSSYADFSALEADEAAVRQLMTVHASVDYLAQATAGDSLMESVIGSDVCAKWINLSDYALDTLSANTDIADEMDTADKYGYGEWGIVDSTTTPPTWGALGNVPIMTANNAPYGTVLSSGDNSSTTAGFTAFDGDSTTGWQPNDASYGAGQGYVGYSFTNPVCVKRVFYDVQPAKTGTGVFTVAIEATNDISGTWTELKLLTFNVTNATDRYTDYADLDNNETFYLHYRWRRVAVPAVTRGQVYSLQFYGRELKPLVPTMTANDKPKGECIGATPINTTNDKWKAFDGYTGTDLNHGYLTPLSGSPCWVGYTPAEACKAKTAKLTLRVRYQTTVDMTFKIQGSDDGFVSDVHDLGTYTLAANSGTGVVNANIDIVSPTVYESLRVYTDTALAVSGGREVYIALQFYGSDYSEKEFAQGSTRKTIYDHGVAPSGAITGGTDDGNNLTLSAVGTATITIDKGTRTYMGGKAGLHASGTNRLKCGSGYSAFTASNMPDSNGFDISSISGSVAVGIEQTASGTFDCTEIWIE